MEKFTRIAIDGPSGAGKSTIAKEIAKRIGAQYIDTGAMYRSIAYKCYLSECNIGNQECIKNVLDNTNLDFINGKIYLDGKEMNEEIRTENITRLAAEFSKNEEIRKKLIEIQRNIASKKNIVMDGRDIGTNVIKDAELKIFLTASVEERAKRRYNESLEMNLSYNDILESIKKRDYEDINRIINPLKKADDAIEIDTTSKNIEEVLADIMKYIKAI